MRWLLPALFLLFIQPIAQAASWEAQTEGEALFIRRIADFWQEGEYQIVKAQIEEFLNDYPDSSLSQTLHATLGDLYVREKNYQGALLQYAHVSDPEIFDRIFFNKMQCLLDLQWFATLADECENFLNNQLQEKDRKLRATYLLAIALYQQCLNSEPNSEDLQRLAKRAQPHFELLLKSELSNEVAQAFAHLCCILKDFSTASQMYLTLAQNDPQNREEMLFQAALLQTEFDKSLALQTFNEIAATGSKRSPDALYNCLVLSFDMGHYADVLNKKEEILSQIPSERQGVAHLFFGRSHLQLKQYPEALKELRIFAENAAKSEALRAALIDMLEIAYQLTDEETLKTALARFSELFPDDSQLPKAYLAHALLLKKSEHYSDALEELKIFRSHFIASKESEPALFEQLHLEYQQKSWEDCRSHCREYLQQFPHSDLLPYVWRYLAASTQQLATNNSDISNKEQLAADLESFLKQNLTLSENERFEWSFLFAKTNYELQHFAVAIPLLESLIKQDFPQKPNAILLLGLCYRDASEDYEKFCSLAERALELNADLMEMSDIHIALFNGYLACKTNRVDLAALHLFEASQLTDIQLDNLNWLADYYFGKAKGCAPIKTQTAQQALLVLEKFFTASKIQPQALDESNLSFESAIVKMAELHALLGQKKEQMILLDGLKKQMIEHPSWAWTEESRVDSMLGMHYMELGQTERALELFDQVIAKNPTLRSWPSAFASLQSARLRASGQKERKLSIDHPEVVKLLSQLKTLILQKNLANEPIHLEAAIEYIDLHTQLEPDNNRYQKRFSLLLKLKADFESSNDLLSRDYQNSRKLLPDKDRIYQAYMKLIEGQIVSCQFQLSQNETERQKLKEDAQKLFEELLNQPLTDFLATKAREQLEMLKSKYTESDSKIGIRQGGRLNLCQALTVLSEPNLNKLGKRSGHKSKATPTQHKPIFESRAV